LEDTLKQSNFQTFLPGCSVFALLCPFEYAGQSFLLHELTTIAVTNVTRSITANFFIGII